MRKKADGGCQLVLLDHGIYTELPKDTRLSYAKLWRGVLSQDDEMLREASTALGCDFHQLFTSMVVNRKYEDVMNKENSGKLRARLGAKQVEGAKAEL